jgi:hypothetical protein
VGDATCKILSACLHDKHPRGSGWPYFRWDECRKTPSGNEAHLDL